MDATYAQTTPKVWIGCLAAYNNAKLHGEWVNADEGAEALWEAQARIIKTSPEAIENGGYGAEEHFIADHEGFPEGTVGEYTSLDYVAKVAEAIEEHGAPLAAYMALGVEGSDPDIDDVVSNFENAYQGEYDSMRDFAEQMVSQLGIGGIVGGPSYILEGDWRSEKVDVIEALESYIDWDTVAREYEMSYSAVDLDSGSGRRTFIFADL